jgi:hypothetical protein
MGRHGPHYTVACLVRFHLSLIHSTLQCTTLISIHPGFLPRIRETIFDSSLKHFSSVEKERLVCARRKWDPEGRRNSPGNNLHAKFL